MPLQYDALMMVDGEAARTSAVAMTSSSNSNSNSDQPRSSKETADVSILREVARNSLVHALNSVSRPFNDVWYAPVNRLQGERSENSRARPFSGWTTQLGNRGVFASSIYQPLPIFIFSQLIATHSNMGLIRCSGWNLDHSPQ